jgi:murein DD-endopeptidase MepM/ murein hydrolase activator NlpD
LAAVLAAFLLFPGFAPAVAVATRASAAEWRPTPSYWTPVIVDGKTFPLARSNFYSLLEFSNNWHDVRLRLIEGKWKPVGVHEGIDLTAESGTPIVSMTNGVVENVGWQFYSGTRVGVRGVDGRYYFYAHLSAVAPGIVPGAQVRVGQMLGRVGNTGYGDDPGHRDEFPPHLHLGIQQGAEWVNPYPTLVSLYEAATTRAARDQGALDALAVRGDRAGWKLRAHRAFTSFGLG